MVTIKLKTENWNMELTFGLWYRVQTNESTNTFMLVGIQCDGNKLIFWDRRHETCILDPNNILSMRYIPTVDIFGTTIMVGDRVDLTIGSIQEYSRIKSCIYKGIESNEFMDQRKLIFSCPINDTESFEISIPVDEYHDIIKQIKVLESE